MTLSKENPGCLCELRRYLSEKTGIPLLRYVWLDPENLPKTNRGKPKYKMSQLAFFLAGDAMPIRPKSREQMKGGGERHVFDTPLGVVKVDGPVVFDKVLAYEYTPLREYTVSWTVVGKYRDNLKGGWYVDVPLIQVDDAYFAPSKETSCCIYEPYLDLSLIPRNNMFLRHYLLK